MVSCVTLTCVCRLISKKTDKPINAGWWRWWSGADEDDGNDDGNDVDDDNKQEWNKNEQWTVKNKSRTKLELN